MVAQWLKWVRSSEKRTWGTAVAFGSAIALVAFVFLSWPGRYKASGEDTFKRGWTITCEFAPTPPKIEDGVAWFMPSEWDAMWSSGRDMQSHNHGKLVNLDFNVRRAGSQCPVKEGGKSGVQGVVYYVNMKEQQLHLVDCVVIPDVPWVPPEKRDAKPATPPLGKTKDK